MIKFPVFFPEITDEMLRKPLSEFERENGITGFVYDNDGKYGRSHSDYFEKETEKEFNDKSRKASSATTKIIIQRDKKAKK